MHLLDNRLHRSSTCWPVPPHFTTDKIYWSRQPRTGSRTHRQWHGFLLADDGCHSALSVFFTLPVHIWPSYFLQSYISFFVRFSLTRLTCLLAWLLPCVLVYSSEPTPDSNEINARGQLACHEHVPTTSSISNDSKSEAGQVMSRT